MRDSGPGYETDEGDSRSFIMGSAERALRVDDRQFDRLVFVEKDAARHRQLCELCDRHLGQSQHAHWRGGGDSWRTLYSPSSQQSLFGDETIERERGVEG